MQKVEYEIHKKLKSHSFSKTYSRGACEYEANELFKTSLKTVFRSYTEVTKTFPPDKKWRHPGLEKFEFY